MSRRKCEGGCGRWLSSPAALALGYGRRCAERLGITPARPAHPGRAVSRPVDALPEIHPDQTALDLHTHQPSLSSL